LYVSGQTNINNNFTLNSLLNLINNCNINNNASVHSNLYVSGTTNFNNHITTNSNIYVLNNTILNGNVTILSLMNISSDSIIQGDTTFKSNLNISGTTLINGEATLSSGINVKQEALINGSTTILTNLFISGNANFNGNITLGNSQSTPSNLNILGQIVNQLPHYETNLLAASAGISEWGFYRTGGIVKVRLNIIPPTINLTSANQNPLDLRVGTQYKDPGAIAYDDDGSHITVYLISIINNTTGQEYLSSAVDVTTSVDINTIYTLTIDTYTLTYKATDIIGNITTVTRILNIIP
jgi:cytoskeletal protein CcmA (bactofilin family)